MEHSPVCRCAFSGYTVSKVNPQCAIHASLEQPAAVAIDAVLHCPRCGLQHIDAPDNRTPDWNNPPHKSHLCHGCKLVWRVADTPTNGVQSLPSRKDAWTAAVAMEPIADAEIKAAYVDIHSSERGWLGIEGSYFISGWVARRMRRQQQREPEGQREDK